MGVRVKLFEMLVLFFKVILKFNIILGLFFVVVDNQFILFDVKVVKF